MAGGGSLRTGIVAEFRTADELLDALAALRSRGYQQLETYSPFAVPGTGDELRLRRSRLPWFVFGGGVLGAVLSYGIQVYANVLEYPQNAGGRPAHAAPAFVLSTFEGTILFAALTAFVGLLIALRLPQLWQPVFEIDGFERSSTDRFWVAVVVEDPHFDPDDITQVFTDLGARQVLELSEAA